MKKKPTTNEFNKHRVQNLNFFWLLLHSYADYAGDCSIYPMNVEYFDSMVGMFCLQTKFA